MKLSLSEAWEMLDTVSQIKIEDNISIRRYPRGQTYLIATVRIGEKMHQKMERTTNILDVIQKLPHIRKLRDELLAERAEYNKAVEIAPDEQMIDYLEQRRREYSEAYQKQKEMEAQRMETVILAPRKDVASVRNRYPRKIEDFTYTNVYGELANVFIY